jgi:anti-sigma B factor antagonist
MIINTRLVGGVVILDLVGKMTLGEGDECLKDNVSTVINLGQHQLLINLAELSYMDAAGLGEIKRSWERMSKVGGKIKLLSPSYRVMGLLKITRMDTVIEVFADEKVALRSFVT